MTGGRVTKEDGGWAKGDSQNCQIRDQRATVFPLSFWIILCDSHSDGCVEIRATDSSLCSHHLEFRICRRLFRDPPGSNRRRHTAQDPRQTPTEDLQTEPAEREVSFGDGRERPSSSQRVPNSRLSSTVVIMIVGFQIAGHCQVAKTRTIGPGWASGRRWVSIRPVFGASSFDIKNRPDGQSPQDKTTRRPWPLPAVDRKGY